jgi:hypothetical protein
MIEFKRKHIMNIIFNHVRFPHLSGTGIIPLKSKLYYNEKDKSSYSIWEVP